MNTTIPQFAIALVLIGTLISIGNAVNWWRSRFAATGGPFHSRVPLLGAGFIMAACLMHPPWRPFVWLPLLLDIGTLELLLKLPAIIRRERRYSDSNRLAEFVLADSRRQVRFKLFREGIALLHMRVIPSDGESSSYEGGTIGKWRLLTSGQVHFEYEFDPHQCLVFELVNQGQVLECTMDSLEHSVTDPCLNLLGARLSACFGSVNTA